MITPHGFFKKFLEIQMEGLTGHIGEAGYPFNIVKWGDPDFETKDGRPIWWVYEQTAYWLDGFLRCSILLKDKEKIKYGSEIIYKVIENADEDGYLGPKNLKDGWFCRWPHVVFFRACLALYEYNHDKTIIEALRKHYVESPYKYDSNRDINNVEIMLYVYNETHDDKLLSLAVNSYNEFNKNDFMINDDVIKSRKKPFVHGVTYNEYAKLGAILYKYTKDKYYLNISTKAYDILVKKFMLPGQLHCSDEFTISNYYYEGYETCDISDFTWSLHYLLEITHNNSYGDLIEKCIFNAGIGSVLENFKGLQYFSSANQLILDNKSNHCKFAKGMQWMSYRPNPGTECCPGNVNRFMPNYILNMYQVENNEIFINLFGASEFEDTINDNHVKIIERTNFPFGELIEFNINVEKSIIVNIRKPGYADKITINAGTAEILNESAGYIRLKIYDNTKIKIKFESQILINKVKGNGLYISKGVLVYSYGMKGIREIDLNEPKSSKDFPAYNIYPDKEWGFEVKNDLNLTFHQGTAEFFDLNEDLSYIEMDAYKIKNPKFSTQKLIRIVRNDLNGKKSVTIRKGDFHFTPDLLKESYETYLDTRRIRLYPYAACKVRETVFKINDEEK